jgi:hypothetical protein
MLRAPRPRHQFRTFTRRIDNHHVAPSWIMLSGMREFVQLLSDVHVLRISVQEPFVDSVCCCFPFCGGVAYRWCHEDWVRLEGVGGCGCFGFNPIPAIVYLDN